MSDALSFAEIDGQRVELLPARTVMSMFSAGNGAGRGGNGGTGGTGGVGRGGLGINLLNLNLFGDQTTVLVTASVALAVLPRAAKVEASAGDLSRRH